MEGVDLNLLLARGRIEAVFLKLALLFKHSLNCCKYAIITKYGKKTNDDDKCNMLSEICNIGFLVAKDRNPLLRNK